MTDVLRGCLSSVQSLKYMSIHTGKGSTTFDIASAQARELQLDFLLKQEPRSSGRSKSHPYFDHHIPFVVNNSQLRANTHSRKHTSQVNAIHQFLPKPNGNYCWISINGVNFLNVYEAPNGPSVVLPLLNWTAPPLVYSS